jgi:hypothetical protein|tara:strand:+ start:443 stop:760 length:318 start_codon:yes stop_codon:yes gene_type:complete
MKIKQHLQKYIGWYFLAMSIWMMFQEGYGTEGFIIFFITLMKVPPFDLVGRMFDWAGELSYKWGMKLRTYKEKQSRPVRVLITILAILVIIFLLWIMPDEECILC